jgi:aryl-alcohol dehydrogenase-like predicted oxidoreductase
MRRRVWRHGTVSAVGFGCMSFGGFYGPTNEADSMRALARALELGVDFWDNANVYGPMGFASKWSASSWPRTKAAAPG